NVPCRMRIAALALALAAAQAAPVISKVEPPNWWIRHTYNPIQILLTGSGLRNAAVTSDSLALRVEARQSSSDGRYLFAYLNISSAAKPGSYHLRVRADGGEAAFDFPLDAPAEAAGRFQGFTPDDVIYLLMPDRFATTQSTDAVLAYHGGNLRGIRE